MVHGNDGIMMTNRTRKRGTETLSTNPPVEPGRKCGKLPRRRAVGRFERICTFRSPGLLSLIGAGGGRCSFGELNRMKQVLRILFGSLLLDLVNGCTTSTPKVTASHEAAVKVTDLMDAWRCGVPSCQREPSPAVVRFYYQVSLASLWPIARF